MDRRKFVILVESFIKRNVDYSILEKLDEDGMRRFIEKFTIEICKGYSPKRLYGISKDEVRELVIDILAYLQRTLVLDVNKLYSYVNPSGAYRLVIAKTKKEAIEIAGSLGFDGMSETYGKKNSFEKVLKVIKTDDGEGVMTVSGDIRPVNVFYGTINLFGNGGVVND